MVWISHVVIAMIRYIVSFIDLNEKFEWKKSRAKVSQMESGDVLIIGAMLLISVQSSYSIYQKVVKAKTRGDRVFQEIWFSFDHPRQGWLFSYPVASNVMVGWVKVENKMCGQCQLGYCFELPDCSVLLRHFVLHLTSLPQAVKKEVKVKTKVEMWYSKTSCFHLTIPIKEVKEVKTKTKAETGYSKTSYSHLTCLMKRMDGNPRYLQSCWVGVVLETEMRDTGMGVVSRGEIVVVSPSEESTVTFQVDEETDHGLEREPNRLSIGWDWVAGDCLAGHDH
ncbi:hypothetical protein E3N88_33067 [Mikania micrantha]|uniref:Uncharacterized protein n=1 Tax=Mikania micrantha TaxID=192012 RepID=A0A5N6MAQ1_9ASTR|nr:hypothetical protein E3N88_33067 [Mikania micrantha]